MTAWHSSSAFLCIYQCMHMCPLEYVLAYPGSAPGLVGRYHPKGSGGGVYAYKTLV